MLHPERVFSEMKRMLKLGGKLVLIDMEATKEEFRDTENEIEKMRDYSHVKNLSKEDYQQTSNAEFLDMFLTAKHLEGCSDKTIRYYRYNIQKMLETINIPVVKISTELLRKCLVEYQTINNCGNLRDRAMIDFLLSTGIRVGELVTSEIYFIELLILIRKYDIINVLIKY